MHFSYMAIVGALLSTVIGSTIPSLDDNALSSPVIDTRAAGGGHFSLELNAGTTEDDFQELKDDLREEFPKVLFRWTKMETVRVKKTATVTLTEKNKDKVKDFLDDHPKVLKAKWVLDDVDQGLMDKRTPGEDVNTKDHDLTKRLAVDYLMIQIAPWMTGEDYETLKDDMKDHYKGDTTWSRLSTPENVAILTVGKPKHAQIITWLRNRTDRPKVITIREVQGGQTVQTIDNF
ncbi:hypothetical protein GLAREA_11211 [Glarea lozoyensis ATCC 20868]|nr:uncharacterized protein GLAREA_11211 [Glarea lozoyensis ATCC 20868]EPE35512.1 hypothetical protein GLAREA_11211 [Glarea lozoyensis ATCC 20868]